MNYQSRDKFFYVNPHLFKNWPYKSRYAIGMKLSDFWARGQSTYRFKIKDTMYEIDAVKANELGKKYRLFSGALPNIIPLEAFRVVESEKKLSTELPLQQNTLGI